VRVAARPFFIGRLSPVERLDLALLVNRQNDGVVRRIDIKADDVAQFGDDIAHSNDFLCDVSEDAQSMRRDAGLLSLHPLLGVLGEARAARHGSDADHVRCLRSADQAGNPFNSRLGQSGELKV
jgi:hypothetical protein